MEAKFPNLGDRDINKKLDGKVASRLGDYVRDAFSDNRGGTLTPKDLRAVYAATAWDWYAREQSPQPSFNAFAARALGHGEKDVGTALSYQQFYVVGASRTFDRAYRRANVQSAALLDARRGRKATTVVVASSKKMRTAFALRLGLKRRVLTCLILRKRPT